jgi:3-dehydroshikimate dehydratase
MLKAGLVSVTFRTRSCAEIVSLASAAGLEGIEWAGDVHVPHGDLARAREIALMTEDAGLSVASYGSYYRTATEGSPPFGAVVDTAVALRAPVIRVWAGRIGSDGADAAYWARFASETERMALAARDAGLAIGYEYHPNTLTDTEESVRELLVRCPQENVGVYWQMPLGRTQEACVRGLRDVLPRLANLHVHWNVPDPRGPEGASERRPLEEGRSAWRRFLSVAAGARGDRWAMIEFVAGDSPEQLRLDASVLRELVAETAS